MRSVWPTTSRLKRIRLPIGPTKRSGGGPGSAVDDAMTGAPATVVCKITPSAPSLEVFKIIQTLDTEIARVTCLMTETTADTVRTATLDVVETSVSPAIDATRRFRERLYVLSNRRT